MAYVPDLKAAVIRSLNRKNAVTAAWAVNPDDVELVSVVPRDHRTLDVTVRGKPSQPTYGTITAQVYRQDIADYFAKVALPTFPTATSVHKLLPDLTAQLGIDFALADFVDNPITWVGSNATVTFQATEDSLFWFGTAIVNITTAVTDINSVYTLVNLNLTLKAANRQQWIDYYSASGKRTIDETKVDVGNPQDPAELGLTSTYNTVIALTAKPNSGLSGVRYVFYTRVDLAKSFEGAETYVDNAFNGTLYDALVTDNMGLRNLIAVEEVADSVLDLSAWPVAAQLKPNPLSFKTFGVANVKLLRYQDDIKKAVLNFNSNSVLLTFASFAASIQALVKKAATLQLEINVGAGVTLCGASLAEPTLSFKPMSGYGRIEIYLTNRGNIYGRGSDYGAFTVTSVASDAINVSNDFMGKIVINNLGNIAGGGGGGSSASGWQYTCHGGGGMPFGKTGARSNANDYPGSNANVTNAGSGGSANISAIAYNGGPGGDAGQPGKFGYRANLSSIPYINFINSDELPRPPGKGVSGNVDLIEWEYVGNVKPALYNKLARFKAYVDSLTNISRVDAKDEVSTVTDFTKPIAVTYTPIFTGANGTTDYPYGSAWGEAVIGSSFAKALVHAFEDAHSAHAGFVWGGLALVEFEPALLNASFSTVIYRNNVSTATLTGVRQARKIGRMVYYDYYRDEIVECFPSQKKGFTVWPVPLAFNLSEANGELAGFKS